MRNLQGFMLWLWHFPLCNFGNITCTIALKYILQVRKRAPGSSMACTVILGACWDACLCSIVEGTDTFSIRHVLF